MKAHDDFYYFKFEVLALKIDLEKFDWLFKKSQKCTKAF